MRHNRKGKTLDRTHEGRKALVQGMACALFVNGKIHTTLPKAKYLRPFAEKFISRARVDTLANRRLLISRLQNEEVVEKLFTEIAPSFEGRKGGYTRIEKSYVRKGDVTQMAYISLVEAEKKATPEAKAKVAEKKPAVKKAPAKKAAAASKK